MVAELVTRALFPVQHALGRTIRMKVAGPDAPQRMQETVGKPGPRWFGPGDAIWTVHDDAAMFASGVTALLLQSLHPLAMAGVAGHSGYKADPWGRLQRTSDYIGMTTFGIVPDAEALIAKVRAVHERVRGKDHRGRPYRASDPRLLLWIHVAEIDSFLEGYRTFSGTLSPEKADEYVAQAGFPAAKLGVPDPPRTVAELKDVIEGFRPELETSPAAIDTAEFLLRTPPLPAWSKPGYDLLTAGGLALLRPWARRMLDLEKPAQASALRRGRLGVEAVRWGLSTVSPPRTPPYEGPEDARWHAVTTVPAPGSRAHARTL